MSRLKTILYITLASIGLAPSPASAFDHSHDRLARVLKRFVHDGLVNYQDLKANDANLRLYLKEAADVTEDAFDEWSEPQQLAFLINVYNASVLKLVLDHYPVASIKRIGGLFRSPWSLPAVHLWGDDQSLDWLEHDTIRVRYDEPRIHFALVCAARGCPPLRSAPFTPDELDMQLDQQARTFLAQHDKNRLDPASGKLYLSPIFKWYRDDFIRHAQTLPRYVRPFLSDADAKTITASPPRVVFTRYDWSLNDSRGANH